MRVMWLRAIVWVVPLLLLPIAADADHDSDDPTQCSTCKGPLKKAVDYVKKNYKRGYNAHLYGGYLFMMLNEPEALKECVTRTINARDRGGLNKNWYLGMSMWMLSEYYLRHRDAEASNAMTDALSKLSQGQESTGGWCHHLGMWKKNNYHKSGGGKDLGILTAMIYAGMWNMKAAGLSVPEKLIESTEKNLDSIRSGAGFKYGTNNGHGDFALSRGAHVLLGLMNAGETEHKYYEPIAEALPKRIKNLEKCHAFGALHFFSTALAMHRLDQYKAFADTWIDKLISMQKKDGSIILTHDNGTRPEYARSFGGTCGNTAVFAIMLLLQKQGAFPKAGQRPVARGGRAEGGDNSPFGRDKVPGAPAPKPEPVPAGSTEPDKNPGQKRGFGRRFK